MGKSDPHLIPAYLSVLPKKKYNRVALLGFSQDNDFSKLIESNERVFYDLSLGNWNINDDEWNIEGKFDLVVSTRCPYFSKDPLGFIEKCRAILDNGGVLICDWGLGDHWRFEDFKVGWVKNDEHEWAYGNENFLWSFVWSEKLLSHPEVIKFQEWIKKFNYEDLVEAIEKEVPSVLEVDKFASKFSSIGCTAISLWEERPQLYVIFSMIK